MIRNPGPALDEIREQISTSRRLTVGLDERCRALRDALVACEAARARVLELNRRGRLTVDEADAELAIIEEESAELRRQLELLTDQVSETGALETRLAATADSLSQSAEELDDIEQQNDYQARRFIVERLVGLISVRTLPSHKRIRRPYTLNLRLTCSRPSAAAGWPRATRNVFAARSLMTM